MPMLKKEYNIYVLELLEHKYYVGLTLTQRGNDRIMEHYDGVGSAWTKKFQPHKTIEVRKNCDRYDEDKVVLEYMAKKGIDNVRGGSFSKIELTRNERDVIETMIKGAENKCYECGSTEHYIGDCTPIENKYSSKKCYVCLRVGHLVENCYAKCKQNGDEIKNRNVCYRCGREDHWKISCTESTDIFKENIDSNWYVDLLNYFKAR